MDRIIFYLFLFFKLIIEMSIMSIIPIISVILINKLFRKKILLKFQYILYLLILLRLLVPIMPKTSFSVFNKLDIYKNKDAVVNVIANDYKFNGYEHNLDYYKDLSLENKNIDSMSFHNNMKSFDSTIKYLFIVWCMGVSGFLVYNSLIYIEFNNKIKRQKPLEDEDLTDLINSLSKNLNITRKFKIVELELLNSPAILGMRKPIILIPKGLLKRLEKDDLKNILIHELCHYKRKDIISVYLSKVIAILYWFNPLVLYSLREYRKTLELSCDEMVLSHIGLEEKLNYGYTIINLINHSKNYYNPKMSLTMVESKKQVANRIKLIRDFKKQNLLSKCASILAVLLIGVTLFTDAKVGASVYINNELSTNYVLDTSGNVRKLDDTNLPFKNDNRLLGKWTTVDFVRNIDDFNLSNQNSNDLPMKDIQFFQNGNTSYPWYKWTKDFIVHNNDKTAGGYYIKNIAGTDYMFFQWKNGDYGFRNRTPWYYVFKKVS